MELGEPMAISTRTQEVQKPSLYTDVHFTPAQLMYLEHCFPNVVYNANSSESEMRHYFGQQAVVKQVRLRTRGLNASSDIPAPGR
jgi:hypothetical protein